MPLRDHFRSPVDDLMSWESFHSQWPAVMVQQFGPKLPSQYVALPRAHLGSQVEIDLATFDTEPARFFSGASDEGGTATAVWTPTRPTLSIEAEIPDADEYEVRVYDTRRGRRLVAAIAIVSPSNKDRREHRRAFVGKCASLMQQRVAVTIVDLVTIRDFNLYAELLDFWGQHDPDLLPESPPLYAVSCRWRMVNDKRTFESWFHPLEIGRALPTLPVWLTESFAVPLELEASYEQTCRDLRIP